MRATFSRMGIEPIHLKNPALSILWRYSIASLKFFIFLCDFIVLDEPAVAPAKATPTHNIFSFLFLFQQF